MSRISKKEFINRSGSHSTRGSRTGVNLLGWDKVEEEVLTVLERRKALVLAKDRFSKIAADARATKRAGSPAMTDDDYEALRKKISDIEAELVDINKKVKLVPKHLDWRDYIIDAVRGRETSAYFRIIMEDARKLMSLEMEAYEKRKRKAADDLDSVAFENYGGEA